MIRPGYSELMHEIVRRNTMIVTNDLAAVERVLRALRKREVDDGE